MILQHLKLDLRRQLINTQQAYDAWRDARTERDRRFAGSMRWGRRNGKDYLLRKIGRRETSLGPRSASTETAYDAFNRGREDNKNRLQGLAARLDELAPINVALGLGRMPEIAARILRRFDESGLLGTQLFVVGTNAIFGYEALAGVFVEGGLLATEDIDLLYDARRGLSLAFHDVRERGLIGLLQQVDGSFAPTRPRSYRAVNRNGYMVDLIRPEPKDVFQDRLPSRLTNLSDDLESAPIFGLAWLINAPKIEAVPIDERGYPVRLVAIDPRAFALHKIWLSQRPDREPLKTLRDTEQAQAAATIATRYLRMPFEDQALSALPSELRELVPQAMATARPEADKPASDAPNW